MAPLSGFPSRCNSVGAMMLFAALCASTVVRSQEPATRPPVDSPKTPAEPTKPANHSLDGTGGPDWVDIYKKKNPSKGEDEEGAAPEEGGPPEGAHKKGK